MKIKLIITSLALAAVCIGAQAQNQEMKPKQNPWFIQLQMGASYSAGDADFGKLIAPAGNIAVGKYFSPVWAARLDISGWRGRVGSEISEQAHGFYYGAATVDGLMNLSQLINKRPERPFDVSLIAGIGFNRAFNSCSSFMGRLGLQGSVRLNDAFDFNVEAMANGVSDRWNGRDDHGIDTYYTLSLGLTYKFVGGGLKCASCISEEWVDTYYSAEEMNALINAQRADSVTVHDTIVVTPDCPPAEKVVRGIRSHVTFALGKTNIVPSQEMNVLSVAYYMENHPDSKATIAGFADKGTGTPEINVRLAKQRAEVVANLLVEKYGISRDRLTISSMQEDQEQMFDNNDWNRVVVITAD